MKKPKNQPEKQRDRIEHFVGELAADAHLSGNSRDRLCALLRVAASRHELWRQCANKPCRRKQYCSGDAPDIRTWKPICSSQWGAWEKGFFAGVVLALGLQQ